MRNSLLISMGVNTELRTCDILPLKAEDVFDFERNCYREYIVLVERKTKKSAKIKVNKMLLRDLDRYFKKYGKTKGRYLFKSNKGDKPISRVQAYRIIKKAANECNVEGTIGCHSLRKTFGYMAWRSGAEPALLMNLFNHSSYNITKRYLGIGQDEKDEIYMKISCFQ